MLISLFVVEPADMQDRLEFHHNRQLAELSPVISKVTLERMRSQMAKDAGKPTCLCLPERKCGLKWSAPFLTKARPWQLWLMMQSWPK